MRSSHVATLQFVLDEMDQLAATLEESPLNVEAHITALHAVRVRVVNCAAYLSDENKPITPHIERAMTTLTRDVLDIMTPQWGHIYDQIVQRHAA